VSVEDVTKSVLLVAKDAVGKESVTDVVVAVFTMVGAMTEVLVVVAIGKVIGGRVVQRALKSSRYGSNILANVGSINGITQFTHSWISVSLPEVQRQEIAVQESANVAAGVHIFAHWSGTG